MNTFGSRLHSLREAADITIQQLADAIGCSSKTISRYENDLYTPGAYELKRIAEYFDVSCDYLLDVDHDGPNFLQKIFNVANNVPIEGETYYCIYSKCAPDGNGEIVGGQTMWDGWVEPGFTERRVLRPVEPHEFMDICANFFLRPMIINSEIDLQLFFAYGGHAIACAKILEEYAPHLLKPFTRARDDYDIIKRLI